MRALPALAVFALCGCVSLQRHGALSVPEVSTNLVALHGKTVRVRGWLDSCQMLSCGLFATKEEASSAPYSDAMLTIGSTQEFDDLAVGRGPAEVIIVARVNADCRTKYVCMDRADELVPIAIRFLGKR